MQLYQVISCVQEGGSSIISDATIVRSFSCFKKAVEYVENISYTKISHWHACDFDFGDCKILKSYISISKYNTMEGREPDYKYFNIVESFISE